MEGQSQVPMIVNFAPGHLNIYHPSSPNPSKPFTHQITPNCKFYLTLPPSPAINNCTPINDAINHTTNDTTTSSNKYTCTVDVRLTTWTSTGTIQIKLLNNNNNTIIHTILVEGEGGTRGKRGKKAYDPFKVLQDTSDKEDEDKDEDDKIITFSTLTSFKDHLLTYLPPLIDSSFPSSYTPLTPNLVKLNENSSLHDIQWMSVLYIENGSKVEADGRWDVYCIVDGGDLGEKEEVGWEDVKGYITVFRFKTLDRVIHRLCQMLIYPSVQSRGLGSLAMSSLMNTLKTDHACREVNVEDPCPAMSRVRDCTDWGSFGEKVALAVEDGKACLPKEEDVKVVAREEKVTRAQVRRVWCINVILRGREIEGEEGEKFIKVGLKRWIIKEERENMVNMDKEQKLKYINGIYEEERKELERVANRVGGKVGKMPNPGKENKMEEGKGEKRKIGQIVTSA